MCLLKLFSHLNTKNCLVEEYSTFFNLYVSNLFPNNVGHGLITSSKLFSCCHHFNPIAMRTKGEEIRVISFEIAQRNRLCFDTNLLKNGYKHK